MQVTITEKLSVIIDKGQKPGHFCKIKKSPQDTILKPEKEDMYGKTRTCGNPNVIITAQKCSTFEK
jgi:hypothetical protein